MNAYTFPDFTIKQLFDHLVHRRTYYKNFLHRFRKNKRIKSVYIREKERYVLASLLCDLGWHDKRIAIPAFNCRSLADVIKGTGNIPLLYDTEKNLQLKEDEVERLLENNVDALIISEVYGIKIKLPEKLLANKSRIILIGDFAHRDSFNLDDDDYNFDIVLYSAAYYKPMKSAGTGIGLILNTHLNLRDSIYIESSLVKNMWSAIQLWIMKIVINSALIAPVYRIRVRKQSKNTFSIKYQNKPATEISIAQLGNRFKNREAHRRLILDTYRNVFKEMPQIKFLVSDTPPAPSYITITTEDQDRDELIQVLSKRGILLGRIFTDPLSLSIPDCPNANWLARHVINLPVVFYRSTPNELSFKVKTEIEKIYHDNKSVARL